MMHALMASILGRPARVMRSGRISKAAARGHP
jgi:hypothetical protein